MAGHACSFSTVPERLVQLLTDELPYSLPLLRRLQFTRFNQGTTQHARIVFASDIGGLGDDGQRPKAFTAAYLDFSSGPDGHGLMYIYSTLERGQVLQDGELVGKEQYERQVANVVGEIIRLRGEYCKEASFDDRLLLMSVHSDVRLILDKFRRIEARPTGYYDVWLFKVDELPQLDETLPPGMCWDGATLDDCLITLSRTDIVRRAETLARFPSLMIKLEESKTPIAWAFLGQDGSLISVHCEEAYRRQGLAKKLAAKLIRENIAKFGNDGWCSAAVAAVNHGSRSMCRALNGKPQWVVSW